jgi:hypothetical protein
LGTSRSTGEFTRLTALAIAEFTAARVRFACRHGHATFRADTANTGPLLTCGLYRARSSNCQ